MQGVIFSVHDRTLHALIGPNGAGKTTAFNLVSGHVPARRGDVSSPASRSRVSRRSDITAAGIGRSFQITNLFRGLIVEENIRLAVQARAPRRASTAGRGARHRATSTSKRRR